MPSGELTFAVLFMALTISPSSSILAEVATENMSSNAVGNALSSSKRIFDSFYGVRNIQFPRAFRSGARDYRA